MIKHSHKTWVEISRNAIISNTRTFQKLIGSKTQLLAVVKSNAYGHGLELVAPVMKKIGVKWFGVDSIDEALRLEAVCPGATILILGYTLTTRLEEAVQHGFRLTVFNVETIRTLGKITNRIKKPAYVHLKCETGTSRQGVLYNDLIPFVKLIGSFPTIILEGLSTHFANIEDTTNHSFAQLQLLKFQRLQGLLERHGIRVPLNHIACTAATLLFPETYCNMVRVGLGLYGLWPSKETIISAKNTKRSIELVPALSWKTCVAQIKRVPRGTSIGYGLTERVSRASKIAVIPVGYWDGFDRKLSSVGSVLINNRRAKILGRLCMNMFVVDVTDIRGVRIEDEVTLLGREGREVISAEEIALKTNTINYEVVSRINPTLPRLLI